MKSKTNIFRIANLTARFKYLLIFSILLIFLILPIFKSIYAQEQWRVFTTQNSPLPSNFVGSIAIDSNNIKWIGTDSGIIKIDGNNWTIYTKDNSPLPTNSAGVEAIDKNNVYWITTDGKGLVKFDGINNWTIYDTINSGLSSNYIFDVAIEVNDVKWIGTNRGLIKYNDSQWIIYDTLNSGLPQGIIMTIAFEEHVKWIGTFSLYGGMAKFNDTNWAIYNTTNSGIPNNTIRDIEIDKWGIKWVGTHFGGGVGRYNSTANSWIVYNTQNSGLPDGYIMCLLIQEHIKWIGTQGGGLARFNDTNWMVFNPTNSPIPSYSIRSLALDSLGNLWISTAGGLVIYNENGIVGLNNTLTNIPKDFVLYQNYPNPFNPMTKIRYELPNDAMITFKIYDILGKEIYSINEFRKAGIHGITFDGSKYASGIYFFRLESGNYIETRKMVLVK